VTATVRLSVRDDGRGMARGTPKGFGLSTMAERVGSLGGSCVIESEPSKGTTLRIEIPVERSKAPRGQRRELIGQLA
jgi:two-component system sensor histidine kinase UhpB